MFRKPSSFVNHLPYLVFLNFPERITLLSVSKSDFLSIFKVFLGTRFWGFYFSVLGIFYLAQFSLHSFMLSQATAFLSFKRLRNSFKVSFTVLPLVWKGKETCTTNWPFPYQRTMSGGIKYHGAEHFKNNRDNESKIHELSLMPSQMGPCV